MARPFVLIAFAAALSAQTWSLPESWDDARAALVLHIRSGGDSLQIVTPALDDVRLRDAVKVRLKRSQRVRLYTTDLRTAANWAVYRNIDVFLLPAGTVLEESVVQTARERCIMSMPLVTRDFQSQSGYLRCGLAPQLLQSVIRGARPYFADDAISDGEDAGLRGKRP